jgi:hypothetical protein
LPCPLSLFNGGLTWQPWRRPDCCSSSAQRWDHTSGWSGKGFRRPRLLYSFIFLYFYF